MSACCHPASGSNRASWESWGFSGFSGFLGSTGLGLTASLGSWGFADSLDGAAERSAPSGAAEAAEDGGEAEEGAEKGPEEDGVALTLILMVGTRHPCRCAYSQGQAKTWACHPRVGSDR